MAPAERPPRVVEAAFWCWMVAAVLLVVGGLMALFAGGEGMPGNFPGASLSEDQARSMAIVYRVAGLIIIACGVAIGYLGVRTRSRNRRYRRFAVALSLAVLLVEAVLGFMFGIVIPLALLALIPLIAAAALATRKGAMAWFEPAGAGSDRDDGGDGGDEEAG